MTVLLKSIEGKVLDKVYCYPDQFEAIDLISQIGSLKIFPDNGRVLTYGIRLLFNEKGVYII